MTALYVAGIWMTASIPVALLASQALASRASLADGYPDLSCPECGAPTTNLVGGSRCTECGWWERW